MKLVLFDIDGTLLRVARTGGQIVRGVLEEFLGRPIVTEGVRFSGRTDCPIIRDVLIASGLTNDEAQRMLPVAVSAYEEKALEVISNGGANMLPGVETLLGKLANRSDVVLGLLTGNIESLAYAKLEACDIERHFAFGAFGSDWEDRYELPAIAVERAYEHTGVRFSGKNVVIVGDTEHDVLCGRALGVYAVAVATGYYDRAFLDRYDPDLLLDDLSDAEGLIEAVFMA